MMMMDFSAKVSRGSFGDVRESKHARTCLFKQFVVKSRFIFE